jgi:hypothetical protein
MRIRVLDCLVVAALLSGCVAGPVLAQDKTGKSAGKKAAAPAAALADVKFGFAAHERGIIAAYYPPRTPPAKKDVSLPNGIEKQLQRGEKLPPGLQNRIQPLPAELERQLPSMPLAYRRGILDNHVIVYMPGSHVIVDVILNGAR